MCAVISTKLSCLQRLGCTYAERSTHCVVRTSNETIGLSEKIIANRYNLCLRTVRSWYTLFGKGVSFQDITGRPKALDSQSMTSLKRKISEDESFSFPCLEITDEIAFLVEQEKIETTKRRRSGIVSFPVNYNCMSHRTIKK